MQGEILCLENMLHKVAVFLQKKHGISCREKWWEFEKAGVG